jgi:hypothetical protein
MHVVGITKVVATGPSPTDALWAWTRKAETFDGWEVPTNAPIQIEQTYEGGVPHGEEWEASGVVIMQYGDAPVAAPPPPGPNDYVGVDKTLGQDDPTAPDTPPWAEHTNEPS